ncbi:MAG: sigma-70 family RNA polymerase sigma factor [Treponemataceae bacterium]|nr:sigma-70 family RNA polymerase sigma factor [Treponemataceae bacterium]
MDPKAEKKITAEKKSENEAVRKRDQVLIKAAIHGSSKAFATLISYYQTRVYRFGLSFFKNNADADDFVQDVFIKVYTNLTSFRGDSQFSTWLMRIAYTTALNNVTRRKECESIPENFDVVSPDLTPEQIELQEITKDAINEALKDLPEKYRYCLDMYFFLGMSYSDISEVVDIPVNTLKSNVFRAKKILKEKLEDMDIKGTI